MKKPHPFWIAIVAVSLFVPGTSFAQDTTWNFDGNLNASSGSATLSFRGDMGSNVDFFLSEHDLGLPMPFGDNAGVMRFGATTPSQGLTVNLNNGGATVSNYTMVWDVFRPGPSWDSWMPLYQTDLNNISDAEFFIDPGDGIGINNDYGGTVTNGPGNISWDRIAVTRSSDGTMKKYIDGALVGTQTDTADSRWDILGGAFNILADNDNQSSMGFISSFRFADYVMSEAEVASLGAANAVGANVAGQQITLDPASVSAGSFTVALLGDTQNYSSSNPEIFDQVTQWVSDNKIARNIQFLVQDGDLVNSGNSTTQWDNARAAMENLDGVVPYAVVRGNTDIGSQFDLFNRFGNGSPYSQQATLVDHYEVPGHDDWDMRNTVHKIETSGQKLMMLTIDVSAGSDVVAWANGIIAANQDYRVILVSHAYMYDGGERFNNAADPDNPGQTYDESRDDLLRTGFGGQSAFNGTSYGGQDGETLWNELVKKYDNMSLLVSGHMFEDIDEFKYHLDTGDNGNSVYELLVDPQNMDNGGNGWIRLLEFDADGTAVHVKTYSPFLDQWDLSPDNFYDIQLSPVAPPVTAYNIFRGFHLSGDLSDVQESDDSYLKFISGLTLNPSEPPVWIEFEGTLPTDSPTSLSVTLEASVSTPNLGQTIEAFNWVSGQYEEVDFQSASFNNDSVVTVDLTADIGNYVESGTGTVKIQTKWKQTGALILGFPWTVCIDQVVWTVTE